MSDEVYVDCPVTGKPTRTGINSDRDSTLDILRLTVGCEHCPDGHTVDGDAMYWLDDGKKVYVA
jgi:hypothetical protein